MRTHTAGVYPPSPRGRLALPHLSRGFVRARPALRVLPRGRLSSPRVSTAFPSPRPPLLARIARSARVRTCEGTLVRCILFGLYAPVVPAMRVLRVCVLWRLSALSAALSSGPHNSAWRPRSLRDRRGGSSSLPPPSYCLPAPGGVDHAANCLLPTLENAMYTDNCWYCGDQIEVHDEVEAIAVFCSADCREAHDCTQEAEAS